MVSPSLLWFTFEGLDFSFKSWQFSWTDVSPFCSSFGGVTSLVRSNDLTFLIPRSDLTFVKRLPVNRFLDKVVELLGISELLLPFSELGFFGVSTFGIWIVLF